ncbi:MAG: hypothetical protein JXB04_09940 [Kiritimatiellae bacterium]|nr:hypothetical protein [Kiritimatiellia bacterium]
MTRKVSPEVPPLAALLLLFGAAFALACRLATLETPGGTDDDSVVGRLLVSTRQVAGEHLVEMADQYFHQGVPHQHERALNDLFQRWHDSIAPRWHRHTQGRDVHEIMPWLRFATQVDPDNVEAYVTAAYWLADAGQRPDLAEQVLREAQRLHPHDYRVYQEKGRLYLLQHRGPEAAAAFDAALHLWPSGLDSEDGDVRHDFGRITAYRAFLCEVEGDGATALDLFRRASAMFPNNEALRHRVEELERGEMPQEWARKRWDALFAAPTCAREGHDHGHDHGQQGPAPHEEEHPHDHHQHDEHLDEPGRM